ncbi:MAG: hypothetical protein IT458_20620 [Planctomycetes bacterium]|nr:hypothetical protein [Planctomycetota bacterium]
MPARDPLAPIGYSVVLLADGLLHVRVVVGDTFVYADTINDSAEARAGLVRDFLELRPDLREHEERLVQILTVRCGVERAYAEAQALRGEVAP